jgi:steroid delta-isomerase-like uncharacterized protein
VPVDVKQLTQSFYDAVNAGDMDAAMALVAEDFVDHEEFPGIPPTRDGVRQFFEMSREAFPDLRMDVDDILVDGDKVAVRMHMSGTHKGDFMGMPASGRRFSIAGIDVLRVVDDKAVEHWGVMDTMAMAQQLAPEGAPA